MSYSLRIGSRHRVAFRHFQCPCGRRVTSDEIYRCWSLAKVSGGFVQVWGFLALVLIVKKYFSVRYKGENPCVCVRNALG